jgi:circadian clock protein KaiC
VSAEEEPAQLLERADALGLPLREAVESGRVVIAYLSQEHTQAAQFPSILSSALLERRAQRLVLDGVSHMIGDALNPGELSRLLRALVVRAKKLGVTSLLTLESSELFARDSVTHWGLSPVSDNLLMLRYVCTPERLRPSLTIIKTRGTSHDLGTYEAPIAHGGMSIGPGIADPAPEPPGHSAPASRRRRRPKL